jgi:hypothetical protein
MKLPFTSSIVESNPLEVEPQEPRTPFHWDNLIRGSALRSPNITGCEAVLDRGGERRQSPCSSSFYSTTESINMKGVDWTSFQKAAINLECSKSHLAVTSTRDAHPSQNDYWEQESENINC